MRDKKRASYEQSKIEKEPPLVWLWQGPKHFIQIVVPSGSNNWTSNDVSHFRYYFTPSYRLQELPHLTWSISNIGVSCAVRDLEIKDPQETKRGRNSEFCKRYPAELAKSSQNKIKTGRAQRPVQAENLAFGIMLIKINKPRL